MTSVNLGVWGPDSQLTSIKIDDINLEDKVLNLKIEASKKLESKRWNIDLVYCGLVLEDEQSLASYGVTSGVTIHVVKKNIQLNMPRRKVLSEAEVQLFVVTFKVFSYRAYRFSLQKLSRPEVLETVIAANPGLAEDPAAIAFIQDPELLMNLADPDTIRRVAERHPALIEAANYIATHLQEDQATAPNQASTSTGYSYSLEALSDDEDMDSDTATRDSLPLTRNSSYNAITSAQLAAAIANATNTAFNTNSAGMPSDSPTSRSLITSEMFNNAIQQAFASSSPFRSRTSEGEETMEAIRTRLQPQLQQMHEMGLSNDVANVRALQATNGDVQAAIELVFSGALND